MIGFRDTSACPFHETCESPQSTNSTCTPAKQKQVIPSLKLLLFIIDAVRLENYCDIFHSLYFEDVLLLGSDLFVNLFCVLVCHLLDLVLCVLRLQTRQAMGRRGGSVTKAVRMIEAVICGAYDAAGHENKGDNK